VTFKFSFPLLSFVQWTQWHTLMIHRLFSQGFDWLKTDRILGVVFKPVYLTSLILVPISCSNLWLDRKFEASALTLFDIRLTLNYLQFPTLFFRWYPNIRTFIYRCTLNCVNTICVYLGRNVIQHQIGYLLPCIFKLLNAVHTSSGYLDLIYTHCIHKLTSKFQFLMKCIRKLF